MKTQRNVIIEIISTISIITFFLFLKIEPSDLILLILTCFSVICFELINTALEFVIDAYFGKQRNVLAKLAKDISAATVLVSVIASILVGIILLFKYIGDFHVL